MAAPPILIIADALPHTGNRSTAERLAAALRAAGFAAVVADVHGGAAVPLQAAAALIAIHARKGGGAALAYLAAMAAPAPPPPPPLLLLLSGTDVNGCSGGDTAAASALLHVCRRAHAVLALSPCLASRYAALAPPPLPRCIYVPQAAASEAEVAAARARAQGGELRAACGLPPDAHVALLVAGVRAVKAPGFLLAAFLAQRQPAAAAAAAAAAVHLLLVGPILDEALFAELRRDGLQLASAAGSGGGGGGLAQYLPPVPRAELLAWMAQASAVLNSSEAEGASCALLEAMAVGGGVVVARRIEGNAALIRHGETGLLFDTPGEALSCCRRVCGLPAEGAAVDARALRAAACTLCDLAGVAARAVEVFGEGAE